MIDPLKSANGLSHCRRPFWRQSLGLCQAGVSNAEFSVRNFGFLIFISSNSLSFRVVACKSFSHYVKYKSGRGQPPKARTLSRLPLFRGWQAYGNMLPALLTAGAREHLPLWGAWRSLCIRPRNRARSFSASRMRIIFRTCSSCEENHECDDRSGSGGRSLHARGT